MSATRSFTFSQTEQAGSNTTGEFDPGSERTLAAGLTHASQAGEQSLAADG